MITGPLPYAEFFLAVGDVNTFGIDWAKWLKKPWRAGQLVTVGAVIRPRTPNGYQLTATVGGQSGNVEPIWPTTIGQTIVDGSVTWAVEALDLTSLSATVVSAQWQVPTGVAVDGQSLSGQIVSAVLDVTQAVVGQTYTVNVPTTMSDGEVKTGRIVLKVR